MEPNPMHKQLGLEPLPPGKLHPYYVVDGLNDKTLVFESRFESGNLRRAIQVYEFEFDLILNPDYNTRGHTQWYYFSVKNTRVGQKYRFNVINLVKSDSLYNYGMKPLVYSERLAREKGIGWHHGCEEICYYQNHIKRRNGFYYTFTYSCQFMYENDTVYFAYCYPLSYTSLQTYLRELEEDPKRKTRFRRRTLCQSLAGNNVDLLTITSFACDPEALRARKGIVITSRVHPGESNASWMMKGVIDFLVGPSLDAKILRDNFVFKIVPMLNPDGVICGNYRCSLDGKDLNRQWKTPDKQLQPTIWHTKQMIKRFTEDRDVLMFCDLHGHSRKKNIFIYGCDNKENDSLRLKERVFPRMLWKNSQCFAFADCNFRVQKAKESTARVVAWRELGVMNSFTMEASFAGANFGRSVNHHFTPTHLEEMGHYFCDTLLDYCDPDQTRAAAVLRELEMLYPVKSYESDDEDDKSFGSDDNPSEDNDPTLALAAIARKARRKKTKKRRKGEKPRKRGSSVSSAGHGASAGDRARSADQGGSRLGQGGNPGNIKVMEALKQAAAAPPPPAADTRSRPIRRSVSTTVKTRTVSASESTKRRPPTSLGAAKERKEGGKESGTASAPESMTKSETEAEAVEAAIAAAASLAAAGSASGYADGSNLATSASPQRRVALPRFPMPYAKSMAARYSEHVAQLSSPRTVSSALLALTRDYNIDQSLPPAPPSARPARVPLQVSHVSLAGGRPAPDQQSISVISGSAVVRVTASGAPQSTQSLPVIADAYSSDQEGMAALPEIAPPRVPRSTSGLPPRPRVAFDAPASLRARSAVPAVPGMQPQPPPRGRR
eukprot:TRINITY_DN3376_c0_g1_i1.p1 TRINITY_DN3376_c0_g1~~TRINITY_DN3376_c0_g1_i1.p1  ORF type:complete len:976 (-),score=156.11 TRINITY_DN3376_c0_g1_i1:4-2508(-)